MAELDKRWDKFFTIKFETSDDPRVVNCVIGLKPICYDTTQMDRKTLEELAELLNIELEEDHTGMVQNPMTGDWFWL
jgi:hypothetical protein